MMHTKWLWQKKIYTLIFKLFKVKKKKKSQEIFLMNTNISV